MTQELLRTRALVTITGVGGIGKTALAKQAIADVADCFEGDPLVIDLTATDGRDGVPELIASRLGSSNFESLIRSSGWNRRLIVLDNCEHVLAKAASAAAQLLAMQGPPTLLATSRAPLELPGETIIALAPLAVPAAVGPTGETSPALRLLQLRARDQGAPLAPSDDAPAAEICRVLDGIPLALEIAAGRLRSRSASELLADLEAQPHTLSRPRFRGIPRQRSVQEMVQWSTDLLDDDTARFFAPLCVFAGPFTTDMAAALTRTSPGNAAAYLDELVAASLITADASAERTWYRLLHPIRAVARHTLHSSGRLEAHQARWVDLVISLVREATRTDGAGWSQEHLEQLLASYPNASAALRWLLQRESQAYDERILRLVSSLWGIIHQRHAAEITELGEAALLRADRAEKYWSGAVATVATGRYLLGDHERAVELADDALRDVRRSSFAEVALRRVVALSTRAQGDLAEARHLFERAEAVATANDMYGVALELRCDHGYVEARLGDPAAGLAKIDSARADALSLGASVNAAWARVCQGMVAFETNPPESIAILRDAVHQARRAQYLAGASAALRVLALAHTRVGQDVAAARTISELLDDLVARGEFDDLRMVLDVAAEIAERAGDPAWADLATTAETLPVTSASVVPHSPLFQRAADAGGRVLAVDEAYAACRTALSLIIHPHAASVSEHTPRSGTTSGELRLEGDVWRITYEDETGLVRNSKGLCDLATLLAQPDRDVTCYDLIGSLVAPGSRQEAIDADARRNLEQRIHDLHDEVEEARVNNDFGRTERLEHELDAIIEHLSSALGLQGRHRSIPAEAERARSAVTHRVRSAIRKLEGSHPRLAAHLGASIKTGAFCSYRPPTPTVWTIER